jgi:uncharacterized protein (TIGR04222 family)
MRRRSLLASLVLSLAVLLGTAGSARGQAFEAIRAYDVQIDIHADDSIEVTETIVYDFGDNPHHGIFRDVPTRLRYDDTYDRSFPLHVVSVTASEGTPADYSVKRIDDGQTEIKIGDPDRTITGVHTYQIVYTVDAALNGFTDHDELYWNAIGNEWDVTIDRATVTVTAPAAIRQVACFTGEFRSQLPCDTAKARGSTARFTQAQLYPYSAMTVVIALPKGAVAAPRPILVERWTLGSAFSVTPGTGSASGGLLVVAIAGVGALLWTKGRDRRFVGSDVDQVMGNPDGTDERVPLLQGGASAPVEFAPPDDLRPGQVGTLVEERATTLDVTSTIVDLAVRGYLLIQEIPKEGFFGKPDWRLIKLEKSADGLQPYEEKLLDGLFRDGTEVTLSSLRTTFVSRLESVEKALYTDAMKRKWFTARPDSVRARWRALGVLVVLLGGALTFVLARWTHWGLLGIPVVIGGILLIWAGGRMPARTAKGHAMLMRVRGFRTVIEKAETNMSRWAEKENVFTQFLPYAIVFGLTEKWAKAFESLGVQPDTSWYVSNQPFVYGTFAHSIDGFTVATSGTIASTPSGSGSSGFGGGGFSGGGGGGGGGGSW